MQSRLCSFPDHLALVLCHGRKDMNGQFVSVRIVHCNELHARIHERGDVLGRIPKRSTIILTNSRNRPWTRNGFETAFNRAKRRAGITTVRFHDLRGTAATRFYLADLKLRDIAEIMAWEEEYVSKIIRRYVGRSAATKELIARLNRHGRER
jgi:integrase